MSSTAWRQVGEVLDGRYEVFATHGRGVFSSVLRARDRAEPDAATGQPRDVAIKIIRANDTMCVPLLGCPDMLAACQNSLSLRPGEPEACLIA